MLNRLKKILIGGAGTVLLMSTLFWACTDDDPTLAPFSQALEVEIIAGPDDGDTILNNAFFTFEWRVVAKGDVTYQVQLSGVDASPVATAEVSREYPGQPAGSYTFTVTANSGSESANDSRTFTVGDNQGPPTITIMGARGSASSGGSGATPAYAPGKPAFMRWTGQDVDPFGEVAGYRWRTTDADAFNDFNAATVAGFDVPTAPGNYTFTLEAMDNVGATSTATLAYEVKTPTIIIVDDKPQGNPVDELNEDQFYADIFQGFSFATWDVATDGIPTIADLSPFAVALVYSGSGSAWWSSIGSDYPESAVQLSDFVDGGGRLWVMGQGIMEDISGGHANPPTADEFESVYLHLAPATGDSATDASLRWARAGDFSGDLKFSFADDALGDPVNFPRITIDVQSGDVENIVPDSGSEVIYIGKGGLGDVVGDVALRSPAGGTGTQAVFMTFPFFENSAIHASLNNSRVLTQEIMREMGQ